MLEKRKASSRKPKVAPVIGSKVKLDKMLRKQMKTLSLSSSTALKARKIDINDESSSSSDADDEMQGVNAAASVPRIGNS